MIGLGEDESFVASAIPAFLAETREVQFVKNGEVITVEPDGATFTDAAGEPVERESEQVDWDEDTAEKGGYETFMLKEIHEQADADRRDDHRPAPGPRTGRPLGARPPGGPAVEGAPDRDRRLRHQLPRGPRRPVRDRAVGAGPG